MEDQAPRRTPCMGRPVYSLDDSRNTPLKTFSKLALLAFPWVGIQAIWQAEFGVTPPFLRSLGLDNSFADYIWISGPVMGFLVAPIVGSYSDHTLSVLGRRRPWMLGGLVFLGVVSIILASSNNLLPDGTSAVLLATPMFSIMDGAINVVQTPTRAFLADLAPARLQLPGQLLASAFQGLGAMVGFALSYSLYEEGDVFWLFITTFFVNMMVFLPVCLYVTEQPLEKPDERQSLCLPLQHVIWDLGNLDRRVLKIGVVQAFSWIALFSFWPVGAPWVGTTILGGCSGGPDCTPAGLALFDKGVEIYNDTGLYSSLLQLLLSTLLACAAHSDRLPAPRVVYSAGLAVGGVVGLLGAFGPGGEATARAVVVLMAVPLSVINSYPFALVGRYSVEDDGGLDTGTKFGILNLFIVVPQLATTFSVIFIRNQLGEADAFPAVLLLSSICFILAALAALFVDETSLSPNPPFKLSVVDSTARPSSSVSGESSS